MSGAAIGLTRLGAGGGVINMSDYSEMSKSRNLREEVSAVLADENDGGQS